MADSPPQTLAIAARRSRVRGVRAALLATIAMAGAAALGWGATAAKGVLLGGIAGALGYWALSLRLERIVRVRPDKLRIAATVWTFYRLAIYAAFFFLAYRLDPTDPHGPLGCVAGLLSTHFAITFLAIRDARASNSNTA